MGTVPALDPAFRKGRLYRASEKLAQTPPGRWYAINIASRIDPMLMRISGGRLASFPQAKAVLLTVPGRKSGLPRTTSLLYYTEGEDVILIASSYGREHHPGWYYNLVAHPECELRAAGRGGRYRAVEVTDEAERRRLYEKAYDLYDGWRDYERRTAAVGRTIPVLRLTPLER
jgi:deazaflavin-dependent oxidoreductase (nitroreductase family)